MGTHPTAWWIGVFVGGFVAGAVCGLLPLIFAIKKGRRGVGLAAFISCVVSGLILGLLLAGPVAIVFTVVIACLEKSETTADPAAPETRNQAGG